MVNELTRFVYIIPRLVLTNLEAFQEMPLSFLVNSTVAKGEVSQRAGSHFIEVS